MKKISISFLLIILIRFSALGQSSDCNCYTVQGVSIKAKDSLELIMTNTCSISAYLNMYLISTTPPFDTLARWEKFSGYIPPTNTPTSSYLSTQLTVAPLFGTYRVHITNLTLVCDSVKFASTMGIDALTNNSPVVVYPNPSNGIFSLFDETGSTTIVIVNTLGEKVYSTSVNTDKPEIDLSKQPKGLYFFQTQNRKGIVRTGKIIIE